MTEEEATNSSPGGSGWTSPDDDEVVADDVVSNRRWACLVDRFDERGIGPRGLSIPPKRLFL
jgi:hypothetical protein